MSKIAEVLKNRNRVQRLQKERRINEMSILRKENSFREALVRELDMVEKLLDTTDVVEVGIEVKEEFLGNFGKYIYKEELSEFNIRQSNKDANIFYLSRKILSI